MAPGFIERTRMLASAVAWWANPRLGNVARVKEVLETITSPLNQGSLRPLLSSHYKREISKHAGPALDPYWCALTHPPRGNMAYWARCRAHNRSAMLLTYLETAPSPTVRAWAVDRIREHLLPEDLTSGSDRPEPAARDNNSTALRTLAWLEASGTMPRPAAPDYNPCDDASSLAWGLGVAIALGDDPLIQGLVDQSTQDNPCNSLPGVDGMLWAIMFDRPTTAAAIVRAGRPINAPIATNGDDFLEKAAALAEKRFDWCVANLTYSSKEKTARIHALAFNATWSGFGPAVWIAQCNAASVAAALLPMGLSLFEQSKEEYETALASSVGLGSFDVARMFIEHGAPLCGASLDDKHRQGAMMGLINNLNQTETALRKLRTTSPDGPANSSTAADFFSVLDAISARGPVANEFPEKGWAWAMTQTLESGNDRLTTALLAVREPACPQWSAWTRTHDNQTWGLDLVAIQAAIDHGQWKHLAALAGGPVAITDSLHKSSISMGQALAAFAPQALPAWLAGITAREARALSSHLAGSSVPSFESGDPENKALPPKIRPTDTVWELALVGPDPKAALSALFSNPHMAHEFDRLPQQRKSSFYALAMKSTSRGSHAALQAVLDHAPAPLWGRTVTEPELLQALTRPRNDGLMRQVIERWPLDACVDDAGNTLLHAMVSLRDMDAVSWLLEADADMDQENRAGVTPRALAQASDDLTRRFAQFESSDLAASVSMPSGVASAGFPPPKRF